LPEQLAGSGIQTVDVVVVGAEEEPAAGERRGALDRAAGLEAPADPARVGVERVHAPAPVADVEQPVCEQRGCLARPDPRAPAHLPEPRREGNNLAVKPAAGRVAGRLVEEGLIDGP